MKTWKEKGSHNNEERMESSREKKTWKGGFEGEMKRWMGNVRQLWGGDGETYGEEPGNGGLILAIVGERPG